jgi:lysophospholipase L1-like esterase
MPGAAGTVAMPGTAGMAAPMAGNGAPLAGSVAMTAGMDALAGMGGMGGTDAPAGMGGTGMPMMREDLGMDAACTGAGTGGQPSDCQVVTIGDSYMEFGGIGTEYSLESISGRNYRNHAVAGTRILNGQIPGQYATAKAANPNIKTVIMTGGGNDIILDFFGNLIACQGAETEAALSPACIAALDEITVGVDDLMATMEADGVQDVFYVGYGHITANELSGTIERTKRVQGERCRDDDPTKTMRCHFVDPSDALGTMFGGDGIHPTDAGYDIIGTMVWERMQMEGALR